MSNHQYMGTPEEATAGLTKAARTWRGHRQPVMGTARQLRQADIAEREARFQLCNAALLWLWHQENTLNAALTPPADLEATKGEG